jgi:transcriptional regulator
MYVPAAFAVSDGDVSDLLDHHGAADLVTVTEQGLVATLLPFVYEPTAGEHGALLGHVARHNEQWRLPTDAEALVIVRGPASTQPWSVDDAPAGFIAGQLRAIVGVEVVISRMEAKAKLSQNRPAEDVDGVIAGLAARGDHRNAAAVAAANGRTDSP